MYVRYDRPTIYRIFKLNERIQIYTRARACKLTARYAECDCGPWQTRAGCSQNVQSNHAPYLSSFQVRAMHNDTHKAQAPEIQLMTSMIVKLSPSVCVAYSSFRRLNLWLHKVLLTMLMEQQTVTNPKVCVPWQNIKSAMDAWSGSPPVDKPSY